MNARVKELKMSNIIVRSGGPGIGKTVKTVKELEKVEENKIILTPKENDINYARLENVQIVPYYRTLEHGTSITLEKTMEIMEEKLKNMETQATIVIEEAFFFSNLEDLHTLHDFCAHYPKCSFIIMTQRFVEEDKKEIDEMKKY